jgi:hypothetical protein
VGTVEERVGRNEAIFREVNKRMAEVGEELDVSRLRIVCECADVACVARIELDVADYGRAREEATVFIVIPEHVLVAVEDTVYTGDGFVFVRKRGQAAEAAEEAAS